MYGSGAPVPSMLRALWLTPPTYPNRTCRMSGVTDDQCGEFDCIRPSVHGVCDSSEKPSKLCFLHLASLLGAASCFRHDIACRLPALGFESYVLLSCDSRTHSRFQDSGCELCVVIAARLRQHARPPRRGAAASSAAASQSARHPTRHYLSQRRSSSITHAPESPHPQPKLPHPKVLAPRTPFVPIMHRQPSSETSEHDASIAYPSVG